MQNTSQLNEHRRNFQHNKGNTILEKDLQETLLLPTDAENFPYLENLMATAQKHPTAALGAMIAVAGIVIAATVTVAVSVFTALFLLYGTVRENTANQAQMQQTLVAIQKQRIDDGNAFRAYASNQARRTEFIVGTLALDKQKSIYEWQKANPAPELPATPPDEPGPRN